MDFISEYLDYIGESEAPTVYHRWTALSLLGSFLGRNYSFKLGHFELYTNLYVMLIGIPATRKSTCIKIGKSFLELTGYDKFSAAKSSKEKFLSDLADSNTMKEDIFDSALWGGDANGVCEIYIACDEFNNFIGINNGDFVSLLGELWDHTGKPYENKIKQGRSDYIPNPTINILGGNTPTGFARAFPPELIDQGFFSRLLLVYGKPTGKKITFPDVPSKQKTESLVENILKIKSTVVGQADYTDEAKEALDRIYKTNKGINDVRFVYYNNRRFTHLLKLCLVVSAARCCTVISKQDVIQANTFLTYIECTMPACLGEYGSGKNSETTSKIMDLLMHTSKPLSTKEIWKHVQRDFNRPAELADVLSSLIYADKIFITKDSGYLPVRNLLDAKKGEYLDFSLLTEEERDLQL